jgi:formylglycine-generating enzyme required for sulfatase activity
VNRVARSGRALAAVVLVSCSPKSTPAGGLVLRIGTDCTLPRLDSLRIDIESLDGTRAYWKKTYRIPDDATLPASFAIRSSGDPAAAVAVELSAWSGGDPLDVRDHRILRIPADAVRQLDVTFSARCTPHAMLDDMGAIRSACSPETCNPETGACESGEREGPLLPPSMRDFGAAGECTDSGPADAWGETAAPGDASREDASSSDATPAGDGGGFDVPRDDRASDESIGDRDGESNDGSIGGCEEATYRCTSNEIQRCDSRGRWQSQASCIPKVQHCRAAGCEPVPPSCEGAPSGAGIDCRVSSSATGDCCASDEVPGGTFLRSYDGATFADGSHPATVSAFRLDDYEVTVGRFRRLVNAVSSGWLPSEGAGKHVHVNGGNGLSNTTAGSPYEMGWLLAWNEYLPKTHVDWNAALRCPDFGTWYRAADSVEKDPINCVNWYHAYAFCVWDGGFLPSEAEWNYAAAAGSAQRTYPWGNLEPADSSDLAVYHCNVGTTPTMTSCSGIQNVGPVGFASAGRGAWGHWDMAGEMSEWTLDWDAPYADPCVDCATVGADAKTGTRVDRGGGFFDPTPALLHAAARHSRNPLAGYPDVGVRCARSP